MPMSTMNMSRVTRGLLEQFFGHDHGDIQPAAAIPRRQPSMMALPPLTEASVSRGSLDF